MSDIVYACEICKKRVQVPAGKPVPLCCKKEMVELPLCTSVPNPEMSRNYEDDEPCADGTQPKEEK